VIRTILHTVPIHNRSFRLNRTLTCVAILALTTGLTLTACEDKKQPATPTTPAADSGKSSLDAAKDAATDAASKAGEKVGEVVDAAKEKAAETAEAVKEKVKETTAAITEKAQAAMKDYLGGLTDANGAMEKIKGMFDVPAGLTALNDAAKKVNTNSAILGSLPAEEQTAVKDANKDTLSSLTATFKSHVERLTKDSAIGKSIGDALKSFKLFE
jgi:di/tripeptidase